MPLLVGLVLGTYYAWKSRNFTTYMPVTTVTLKGSEITIISISGQQGQK